MTRVRGYSTHIRLQLLLGLLRKPKVAVIRKVDDVRNCDFTNFSNTRVSCSEQGGVTKWDYSLPKTVSHGQGPRVGLTTDISQHAANITNSTQPAFCF